MALDARTAAGLAFGVGAALLTAGIAFFAHYSGRPPSGANGLARGGAVVMAARNSGRNRARSLLCVTLMASASFVIVIVAANRLHREIDVTDPASGAGGFSLVAETDVPIFRALDQESPGAAAALGESRAVPFRVLPGEDVSCLNLYRPERPRVLGAPPEMIERGGFTFSQAADERENPWELLDEPLEDGAIPAIGDYNSVLWILHSGLGQDVIVENERGEPLKLRLVGLLGKSLFQSELVISEAQFQRHFPSRAGYSYFLLDPEPARAAAVATELERELARFGFDAVGTRERLASYQAVEDTYLSTFQTLGGLGLLLGTLGMGVILLRNVLERRAELATLRALGFRRSRLRALVLLENALLLLVGPRRGSPGGRRCRRAPPRGRRRGIALGAPRSHPGLGLRLGNALQYRRRARSRSHAALGFVACQVAALRFDSTFCCRLRVAKDFGQGNEGYRSVPAVPWWLPVASGVRARVRSSGSCTTTVLRTRRRRAARRPGSTRRGCRLGWPAAVAAGHRR